jgi:hypothetical protein
MDCARCRATYEDHTSDYDSCHIHAPVFKLIESERAARVVAEAERNQAREQLTDVLPERDALCSMLTQTGREHAATLAKLEQLREVLHRVCLMPDTESLGSPPPLYARIQGALRAALEVADD